MRRISTAFALSTLLLISICSAQQTAGNASTGSEPGNSPTPSPGSMLGGTGKPNQPMLLSGPHLTTRARFVGRMLGRA
jgi:hypothetical protein